MTKITPEHLARQAIVYIRQSTADQVANNLESQRRQYNLPERARQLGWSDVAVIDDDLGRSGGGIARPLDVARGGDARGHLSGAFRRRRQDQIGGRHRRHFDPKINAVHQRSRDARLIIAGAAVDKSALAGIAGLIGMAAAAGVHRRDQHEARRIGDAMVGARYRDLAVLERLAQRIQHPRIEFRQLIQKQHALMRQLDFAGPGAQAAARQCGHAGGMVR